MKKQMIKTKKAQVITVSILVILFIFLLVLTLFFDSLITRPFINNDRTRTLELEATRLSDSLILPGYPENWHETSSIQKIGLATNNSLDLKKINNLSQLAQDNYDLSKIHLGIQNDYFINITYKDNDETKSIIIKSTDFEQEKKFAITRQRATLIKIDDYTEKTAKIFIMIYS
jgi:hypothetical protein